MSPSTRQPQASIILPVTGGDDVTETLESILGQTFTGFELIVVSGMSGCDEPAVPDAMTDPRIVSITTGERTGTIPALNAGIRAARGELVGFAGCGEIWDDRRLEEQVAAFAGRSQEYGVVYSDLHLVTPAGTGAYWHAPVIEGRDLLDAYGTGFLAAPLGIGPLLVRRAILEKAGLFDERLRRFAETDMVIRLQRLCRFHHIPKPLCTRRRLPTVQENPFEQSIARILLLEKYPETLANPLFVSCQADLIRQHLLDAQEKVSGESGTSGPEQEHGYYREPVPYT